MDKINLTVETKPTYVWWKCPYCEHENRVDYDKFVSVVGIPPWAYEELGCEGCNRLCEIDSTDWR